MDGKRWTVVVDPKRKGFLVAQQPYAGYERSQFKILVNERTSTIHPLILVLT
jgi:hypothetical protein